MNVNDPAYADLAVPGGWLYMTGGSMGLIVYRYTPDEFKVYDRHCPIQPEDRCRLFVDGSNIANDMACCSSAYSLIHGGPTGGPAALSLQQYHTSFNGTTFRVYN